MEITRTVDHALYPRRALTEATHAYRDYCDVKITPITSHKSHLKISVKQQADAASAREVILEFLNYALDKSIHIHLENE